MESRHMEFEADPSFKPGIYLETRIVQRLTPLRDLVVIHRHQAAESRWFANRSILLYVVLQKARIQDLEKRLDERVISNEVPAT